MLSRTAESLYWLGRYIERAENMARIIDVSQRLEAQGRVHGRTESEWQAVLTILSAQASYKGVSEVVDQEGVTAFVTLDQSNPSSIWNCVRAARENARALRATISSELWECVNATWLGLRDLDMPTIQARGIREFLDWVKERSHQFRGVAHGTMLHNESFAFNRLGTFIERADNTARLLDTKYTMLAPDTGEGANADPGTSYYEWGAVLRAVSAFRAYHQVYKDIITSERVAEMLVLRAEMPRSLRFCFDQVTAHLEILGGGRQLECERLAGEFRARLRYGRMERILDYGLHPFLGEAMGRIADISVNIGRDFLMTV
jgi:uncharacterized alpha-E superfamily protein